LVRTAIQLPSSAAVIAVKCTVAIGAQVASASSPVSSRRATQLEVDISGVPNVAAHFKRMQERPSVKKLLA